jgi:Transcriptional regulator, AbiEi antitoxin
MAFHNLTAYARRQHGLVTRTQMLKTLSRRQLDNLVHTGRLERLQPSTYRVAGSPESLEQMLHAAILASGDGAAASFRAAAHLWYLAGFWEIPTVEITTPSRRRTRLDDVIVHDTKVTGTIHFERRRGIPVTSVARTLCDLSACCSPNEIGRALDDALRRKLVTLRRMRAVFEDLATRGRRRSTIMRELLAQRGANYHPGGSDPEVRMMRVLQSAGLPDPIQQHTVRINGKSYRLDGAFIAYKVALEYEGFEFHRSRTSFDVRYERDRDLKNDNWWIVYITSRTSDERLVSDTRYALETRGYPGPPVLPSRSASM